MDDRRIRGLGRQGFLLGTLLLFLLEVLARMLAFQTYASEIAMGLSLFFFALILVAFRLRNAGQSPWITILCIFPPAFIGVFLYCLFKASQRPGDVPSAPMRESTAAGLVIIALLFLAFIFGAIELSR